MTELNFHGSDNPFYGPMTSNIKNGINISTRHRDICYARRLDGATELIMFNNYDAVHHALIDIAGVRTGDKTTQPVLTGIKENYFDQMPAKLRGFKNAVIPTYDTETDEFKMIFGENLNRFYRGGYTSIANCVNAMAGVMHTYAGIGTVETAVIAYYNQLIGAGVNQHVDMSDVEGDSAAIIAQLAICAGVMDQNLGYAKVLNATNPDIIDRKAKIDSWFPLDIIQQHEPPGFEKNIPVSITEYLGTKTFKPGDKVLVTIIGASVNIGTSYDRKHAAIKFVTFNDGAPVLVDPFMVNWDLTQHNWVATNLNPDHTSHVSFTFQLV